MVVDLIEHNGCQVNSLVGYFGEKRTKKCGHCTFCLTKKKVQIGSSSQLVDLATVADLGELNALRQRHSEALGTPRQMARFLCGLSSPAFTKAKLSKHPLFSRFVEYRFQTVLNYCSQQS